jgi:phosphoribosylamine--glycine ligase
MRLQSDLVDLCFAAINGKLNEVHTQWDSRAALGVVLAAKGYPESYEKGFPISGLESGHSDKVKVFHAGTTEHDGEVVTSGGRVLCVTALGDSVSDAQQSAYSALKSIAWEGMFFRNDIGYRAIARELN